MEWLRDQVRAFPRVKEAEVEVDDRGRRTLAVRLGKPLERAEIAAIRSLLDADIVPMLVFDAETLEIAGVSNKATAVFELAAAERHYSLADLFAAEELDRLGERLAAGDDEWSDGDDWNMLTRTGKQISVHNWYAPSDRTRHRLLISLPAIES